MENRFEELLAQVRTYNDKPENIALITKAWEFAKLAHGDQKRDTGDPFIIHPLTTALYCAQWKMDTASIVAALLHDTINYGGATEDDLQKEFGNEAAELVERISRVRIPKIRGKDDEA